MPIFRIEFEKNLFLIKGSVETKLSQTTQYHFFAANQTRAIGLVNQFVGDLVGQTSPRIQFATFDKVEDWLQVAHSAELKSVDEVIEDLQNYIGSIQIEGAVIVSPDNEDDLLILALSEGEKKRVLAEPLYLMDQSEGGMQWGDTLKPLHVVHLAKAVQALF